MTFFDKNIKTIVQNILKFSKRFVKTFLIYSKNISRIQIYF